MEEIRGNWVHGKSFGIKIPQMWSLHGADPFVLPTVFTTTDKILDRNDTTQ